MSETIVDAEARLVLPSSKQRAMLWGTALKTAIYDEAFLAESAPELVRLVMATLPLYTDPRSQRMVASFVKEALSSDAFMKGLAGAVVKAGSGSAGASLPRCAAFGLLRFSALLLQALDPATMKKAVTKLVEVQAALLEAQLSARRAAHSTGPAGAARSLVRMMRAKPHLADEFLELAKGGASAGAVFALHEASRSDAALCARVRPELLEIYVAKVLGGKERPSAATCLAYRRLLRSVTPEEFSEKVLPAVTRNLRRVPEAAMACLAAFAKGSKLDLSAHAAELTAVVVSQLRLKESTRPLATDTVRALAARVGDGAALAALTESLVKLLDGSAEGKIKAPAERCALIGALLALADSPALPSAGAGVASKVTALITTVYKDESNDDVKAALLGCLPHWMVAAVASDGGDAAALKPAVDLLAAAPKEAKDGLRRAALRAAGAVLAAGANNSVLCDAIAEPYAALVGQAVAKPILRADGVLALRALARTAAQGGAAQAALRTVWPTALAVDSPLLAGAAAARLAEADAVAMAQMGGNLLALHGDALRADGSLAAVCRLIALLALHHARTVRAAARAATAAAASADPALVAPMAEGLLEAMARGARGVPTFKEVDGADASEGAASSRFGRAVAALVPQQQLAPDAVALLLLAAHHPAAASHMRVRPHGVWNAACKASPALLQGLPSIAPAVVARLAPSLHTAAAGAAVNAAVNAAAARGAVAALMAACPEAAFSAVHASLAALLDATEFSALTEDDVIVYETPEGMLASERPAEGVYVGEVAKSRNTKKAKGRFAKGSRAFAEDDDSSDEEDSKPAPAPVQKGPPPKLTGAAARQAEQRARRLEEEAATRARMGAIKARLESGLHALSSAVSANAPFAARRLEELQALCLPLLPSRLVGTAAVDATCRLAACLPGRLGGRAAQLTDALRAVAAAGGTSRAALARQPAVASTLQALQADALSPQAYRFVYPVLRAVLGAPEHTPLHEQALTVLSQHCGPGDDIPRADTITLLYHTLGVVPAYKDRIVPLLSSLCAGAGDPELPAAVAGVVSPHAHVRSAALSALSRVPSIGEGQPPAGEGELVELYMARFDAHDDNVPLANELWVASSCELPRGYVRPLLAHLASDSAAVRAMAGAALSNAMAELPDTVPASLEDVLVAYANGGSATRLGVAGALGAAAQSLGDAEVTRALDFLVRNGLADVDEAVRSEMVSAGSAIVDAHGAEHAPRMLPLFEGFLEKNKGLSAEEESAYDLVRGGVVVFLGTLARHLPKEDPKRAAIVETLVSLLGTPSESVQRSVSMCLPPLVQPMAADKEYVEGLVSRLLAMLTRGADYGERRGAAFGLAGLVKGLGIMSMKNYGIMDSLKAAVENKQEASAREGALLAFECLSEKLGKLFEPYIIYILPLLLQCFGDVMPQVRQATDAASHMIMGNLTASGVKLVLPALLKGLEDKAWRTKQGSVQLLGAMAYCAPKQLGTCLPTIVPRLSEVLSDPHPKVQAAANESLREIGSVIRNPEVQGLVPHLMAAIADPNNKTRACLDVLLETVFVNTIDAPSLALIVPVVYRGLRDRMGDTKRRAARIVGNMCTLINDSKDMTPYVPLLMPELQKSLVDPLPEVRATSARAMGSLLKGMGSEAFADLVPWLMATLRSNGSSVERSGAAQGLAEVLSVLGTSHLEALLPDVMHGCKDGVAHVREGHLTLFQFLPITLESTFQPYLSRTLPLILDGLADESEGVRDASLTAGRVIVDHYTNSAMGLLLPAIEKGLSNESWRIRQSSVLLLGKLLFKVVGASGNIVLDGGSDDEGAAEAHYSEAIVEALGTERRNQVLSRLYTVRSDPQYSVRSEALHVWKTVVVNTPKTLLQILPCLMAQIIAGLASTSEDLRVMAARCIGELCRKMGERIVGRIVPILREGIASPDAASRQGVCLGLKEVLENISRPQLADHMGDVLPTVQAALTDEDAGVRSAAGEAFAILFKGGSGGAVDSVVPAMIAGLESESTFTESIEGLRVIQLVRPTIFNFVLPKLIKEPMSISHIKALGVLSTSAGHTLNAHLGTCLLRLLTLANGDGEFAEAAKGAAKAIALSVQDDGLHILLGEFNQGLEDSCRRRATADLIVAFASKTTLDFQDKFPQLLDSVIVLLGEDDAATLQALWDAMQALCATVPKEEHASFVRPIKEAVSTMREKERRRREKAGADPAPLTVAGFCLPKALSPLLPFYLAGVLQGSSSEVREMAAEGLGELVGVTSPDALKPFVVTITGPLIRIIGDRFPSTVKAAILVTLGLLIDKAGVGLKPFVPQLQTTFLKCLNDPEVYVRLRAAANLGQLSRISARIDQLASDLVASAKTAEPQVRDSYLDSLAGLLLCSGDRLTAPVVGSVGDELRSMVPGAGADEGFATALACALGALCAHGGSEQLSATLSAGPLATRLNDQSADARLLAGMVMATVAKHAGAQLQPAGLLKTFGDAVAKLARDPDQGVKATAARAAGRLAASEPAAMGGCIAVLVGLMGPDQGPGVQQAALHSLALLSGSIGLAGMEPHLPQAMPSVCGLMASTAGPTKRACEVTIRYVLQLSVSMDAAQRFMDAGAGGSPAVRTALTTATLGRITNGRDELSDIFSAETY
ncbi:hypothetical protein FOA52_004859 [Chlamydomonas sp. UWO 241]|nr:hypothetical protein FOA52_004859 [Chlamydomonas sp. UWO 241]